MMDELEQERFYVKTLFNAVFPIMKEMKDVIKIHNDEIRCNKNGFTLYDEERAYASRNPVCTCKNGVVYGAKDELDALRSLDFDLTCIYSIYYDESEIPIEEIWIHDMFNPGYRIRASHPDVRYGHYYGSKADGMYVVLLARRLKKQMFGDDAK